MKSYKTLCSFPAPRCRGVTAPTVSDMIRHPPPEDFKFFWRLKPDVALAHPTGEVWVAECDPTAPYPQPRQPGNGRLVIFRDGLLFLPNTNIATLREVGQEVGQVVAAYTGYLGMQINFKLPFLDGAEQAAGEAFGKGVEAINDLLTEMLTKPSQQPGATADHGIPLTIRSSLAKKDAIVLPYAQLVEVTVNESEPPGGFWQRLFDVPERRLCLVREDDAGKRSAYSFSLYPDENRNEPFNSWDDDTGKRTPEYVSGKLNWREGAATALFAARAGSDIGALWRSVERERLGDAFLSRLREKAARSGDPQMMLQEIGTEIVAERRRQGTTDAAVAQIVLERLGSLADAFSKPPYANYRVPDHVAALRAAAAKG